MIIILRRVHIYVMRLLEVLWGRTLVLIHKNRQYYEPWEKLSRWGTIHQNAIKLRLRMTIPDVSISEQAKISPSTRFDNVTSLRIGSNSCIGGDCLFRVIDIVIGDFCSINPRCFMQGKISIGNQVRMGPNVSIIASNHIFSDVSVPIYKQGEKIEGITIKNDVWIGAGVIILDGVTVESHCVIGAGSVVTKSFEEYSVVAGNPAKLIRKRK